MANSSNPDPSDLGLRLTPFERCYDPNAEILIEADDAPFDPQIEAERAARIVSMEEYSEDGAIRERLRFSEPLFDKMPGPERAAWWAEHLVALRDPAKWRAGWGGGHSIQGIAKRLGITGLRRRIGQCSSSLR